MTTRPRPFKLRAPVVPEDDFQAQVAKALNILLLPPAVWFAMPVGHVKLAPAQAARLARIGVKRGLPDLMIVHNGKLHGIELKAVGGHLSRTRVVRTRSGAVRVLEGQDSVFAKLERAGVLLAVCASLDAVLDALEGWGVPMLRSRVAA